jgi:murein DD-endopeptidase MepM/ murein hydrolase activator NlpD
MRAKLLVAALALAVHPACAHAAGDPGLAAVQRVLLGRGLYAGPIDGVSGPATETAVRAAQQRAGITVDGVVGPQTRRALSVRELGSRPLVLGARGSDVVALQFALSSHGFPCGTIDGVFGLHTANAVRRFQRFARLAADAVAGPATFTALRTPPPAVPIRLARPVAGLITDGFGPRGLRFHAGVDIEAWTGTPVTAAAAGRVSYAGWLGGGWGLLVTITHGRTQTLYAHLSRVDVGVGQLVGTGTQVGLVGATGDATGPHLHFEVRVNGAAVDPLPALGGR